MHDESGYEGFLREPSGREAGNGIYYGWWLVLLAGLVTAVASVLFFHSMAIWALALDRHFMWSRSHLAAPLTISRAFTLLVPLVGYLTDRLGPRRLILPGLCITAAGFALFALVQGLGTYYPSVIMLAVGAELCSSIPLVVMLSHWFVSRRAVAIAVFLFIPAILAIAAIPLIALGVDTETLGPGWRTTALIVAGIVAVVAVVAFFRLRNTPEDLGLSADGDSGSSHRVRESGFSLGQTLHLPPFWFIAFGNGLASASYVTARSVANSKGLDIDADLNLFGLLPAVGTPVSVCFYLVGGLAGDRFPKYRVLASFAIVQAGGVLVLFFSGNIPTISLALTLMSAGAGGLVPLSLAVLPDYFGTGSLGSILGVQALLVTLVTTAIPATALVEFVLGENGSYTLALLFPLIMILLAAFLFLKATPPRPLDSPSPWSGQG